MNITLVCPTNAYGKSATKGIYYPMGIVAVGSLIKDTMPSWHVKVIDGELHEISDLEAKIEDADILGVSANTNNYPYCLRLAEHAKRKGIKHVIMGGPHATAVPEQILRKQDAVDAVIVFDGEHAFLEYLLGLERKGNDFSEIPNFYWRDAHGKIKHNKIVLPIKPPRFHEVDYSLFDLSPYWTEHKKEFPGMNEKFIEYFTHVGCTWRQKTGGCRFCDIPYPANNYVPPEQVWRDISDAKEMLGITAVKDYGDCITGNPERVRALIDARPSDLEEIEFSVYGRSVEITDAMAELLQALNVRYVYVGFDAGSNPMLRNMRQGYSVKANHDAAERLGKRGINITGSLILGTDGETSETIAETEQFAKEIAKYQNVHQLHCAVLNIFPAAPYAQKLIGAYPALRQDDRWNIFEIQRLWIEKFCAVSQEYLHEKAREIGNFKKSPGGRVRYFGVRERI